MKVTLSGLFGELCLAFDLDLGIEEIRPCSVHSLGGDIRALEAALGIQTAE